MSSAPETLVRSASEQVESHLGLLDLLIISAKYKRLIVSAALGAAVISALLSLLLANIYTGTARILPPQQNQSTAAMLLGQLGGFANLSSGSVAIKNPNDLYVGMLKSRTIADSIISRFDLKRVYDLDTLVETRQELEGNSRISSGKDGLIAIDFDDEDPDRAAAVANAYVEELDKLTQSLAVTEAAQRRLFFEQQLAKAKDDLSTAEVALKITQEQTGLIKLDDQGRAIIASVAELRGQIAAKEVELRALRTFSTPHNPVYVRAQQQLAGLRVELSKLERAQISGEGDILLPTGKVPAAGLEYVRKLRDVKYQETIFELLAKQFEAAKIDESKEAAVIQIVDTAVPADRKSKPKRALIVILGALAATLIALLYAIAREVGERLRQDPAQATRLDLLRRYTTLIGR